MADELRAQSTQLANIYTATRKPSRATFQAALSFGIESPPNTNGPAVPRAPIALPRELVGVGRSVDDSGRIEGGGLVQTRTADLLRVKQAL